MRGLFTKGGWALLEWSSVTVGRVFLWCSLTAVPQELADAPKLKVLVLDPNPFIDKKLTKVLHSC